jgi:LPS export ABC transporter protein LptC
MLKKIKTYKILFLLTSTIFISCKNNIEEVKKFTTHIEYPEFTAENISIYRSDSAKVIFRLSAPQMIKYNTKDKNYILFPKGIYAVHYFPEYPNIESYIKANYAKYLPEDKLWEAKGNVKAQNRKGEKLFAEQIFWDQKKQIIYSDKNVKIQTEDEIIYGKGFEADQYFEHYKIKKIRGTVYINDSTETN